MHAPTRADHAMLGALNHHILAEHGLKDRECLAA
jgi:hypothetical protein